MVVGDFAHEIEVVVIGGGPGGYHAAIRAAQLGKEVAIIEQNKTGGMCLNDSCIPSKLFTEAAGRIQKAKEMEFFGIHVNGEPSIDLKALQARKEKVIGSLHQGVEALLKKYKIQRIQGTASFISDTEIGVERQDAFDKYKFEQAIIAAGASYKLPEEIPANNERIIFGASLYRLEEIPKHLIVYGSDYITLEAASVFASFGSKITIILDQEKRDFSFDVSINKELSRLLKKRKIKVYKEAKITDVNTLEQAVYVTVVTSKGETAIEASHLFTAGKQSANTNMLQLEACGVEKTEDGFIPITNTTQTSQSHIYAVGDVTASASLAVEAIKQGKVAGEQAAGKNSEWEPGLCPVVVHTVKPIAVVGLTEEEALQEGHDILISQFPLRANGYAALSNETEGLVKIISEKETEVILGYHAIGYGAAQMITAAVQVLEMGGRMEDVTYPYYPHPSINEAWLEAAEGLLGKAVHQP
ncbi:dihydrolipoyl dehydrogenase family protein [Alteribacillus bidgolensis]|uniref:Dihydrolipoamide dehydrogenase n=1 Tax=Alteribacillus bidgolensis TaxID=930129 RepID=A0A1G8I8D5_9BACI|nr:FAD-dependent oxidoreductase [Alteribacillus bidgolensis]SDI15156.1 dihydrolipoamide dehydrogenase [Alteribacillus bidgolensis]